LGLGEIGFGMSTERSEKDEDLKSNSCFVWIREWKKESGFEMI